MIEAFLKFCGYIVSHEPRAYHSAVRDDKRIDFQHIDENGDLRAYDFTIVLPTAPSYLHAASISDGAAAKRRENAKKSKYRHAAELEGFTFIPFVVEAYGRWGDAAEKAFRDALAHLDDRGDIDDDLRALGFAKAQIPH